MNRCTLALPCHAPRMQEIPNPSASRSALLTTALLLGICSMSALWPGPAAAQDAVRQFPKAAKRATLEVTAPPQILLNGQPERLSPGARIKAPNNLLVMSGSLVGQRLVVNYLRDPQGLVHEIWLLNGTEASEKRAGMEPVTNFVFGSDGDKPKTDDGKTPFNQLPKFPSQ